MTGNLASKLQVWGFEKDFIIFQDASIGFAIEATPIDVSTWDNDRLSQFAARIDQFLNGLPSNLDIQFVQEIISGNEETIERHFNLGNSADNATVSALTKARVERLTELDRAGLLPKHRLKIFVRNKNSKVSSTGRLWTAPNAFAEMTSAEFEREIQRSLQIRENISSELISMGLKSKYLNTENLVSLMYKQWNPNRPIALGEYDEEDIRTSILFSDVNISESGFSIGDIHYRVISLKALPEVTVSSMAQTLRDLPFDSKLFLSVHVPDQQKELNYLQTQRRIAFSMARGKRSGVSDIASEAKLQDLESLLEQMIAQGEKVFQMSLNVLLCASSASELESQIAQTLSKVRELSGAEAMQESLASFDIFSEFAIPNAKATERAKRIKTTNLSDFLPIYGPWPGHEEPSILLRSRMGSLLNFDPFSKELSNHNQLISGGSGSGKSFCATLLLSQLQKENPKVYIVDIGASYKKLCEHFSGQYIPLGVSSDISINPFDLLPGEIKPSGEKIKFLVSLVEIITKEDDSERLPKLERAELEEAICQCYDVVSKPRLSSLQKRLSEHQSLSMKRFARILYPWCGDTTFGKFVDRPTNLSLQSSIVSFDLKGLDAYPDLQAVCLFIITDLIWREVQKCSRSQKKILCFDECWKLLESEAGSSFIGEVFRTFRKYYAGVIAISQDIDDFAKSKIAGAILPNSAIKWILMQKGANQARLKEVLQLNENEMSLVASLRQERGLYSEAFLIAGDDRAVVAIEATPLEYWIATTDPRDIAVLETLTQEKNSLTQTEILIELSEKYPQGVAHQKGVK
jgi:conjugal transfer ATP-binding protein TraC